MRVIRTFVCVVAATVMAACDCFAPTGPSSIAPDASEPTAVSLSVQGAASVRVAETTPWQAVVQLSDGSRRTVTTSAAWSSSAAGTASVSDHGVVGGVAVGQAMVQATYSGLTGSGVVSVVASDAEPPTVLSLAIEGADAVRVGQSIPLQAVVQMSDGSTQTVTALASWTSDAPSTATVSGGTVTGVAVGEAPIRASYGGQTATRVVTVSATTPETPVVVTIAVSGNTAIQVGQHTQLHATASFSNGTTENITMSAAWSSSATNVATISNGLVAGVGVGNAPIQATFQGRVGATTVTVTQGSGPTPTVQGLRIQGATTVQIGQTAQLQAIASMSDGTSQTVTGAAAWTSNMTSVATVANGLVSGVAAGSAPIQASYQGQSASATIAVTQGATPPPIVQSLSIQGANTVQAGQTTQLQAIAQMSNGTTQNVTTAANWTSSAPATATVAGGLVTGIATGGATIGAAYAGTNAQAPMTVTAGAILVGLEVDATVDLTQVLLNQPFSLQVLGVYSDGSKQDVTSAAVISADTIDIHHSTPGTLTVALTLVDALLDPNHVVDVQYGGFTESVNIVLKLPGVQALQLGTGGTTSLALNSQLPAIQTLFDGGATADLAADFPGVTWSLQPRGALNGVLSLLGLDLTHVLTVNNGRLVAVGNGLLDTVVGLLPGGLIPLDLRATYGGVPSNVLQANVSN